MCVQGPHEGHAVERPYIVQGISRHVKNTVLAFAHVPKLFITDEVLFQIFQNKPFGFICKILEIIAFL
jgi:hypothetical protein